MKRFAIGSDVGGSHISCALIDMNHGNIVQGSHRERNVDNKGSVEDIIRSWRKTISETMSCSSPYLISGIGIAMPGPFDYENGIALFERVAKFESLYGINIKEKLCESLKLDEETPIRFMNDASAFAAGEAWQGRSMYAERSASITLGTGFGSAFILDGIPTTEGEVVPPQGCLWHLPFKDGIADDYVSTRWFIDRYYGLSGHKVKGAKELMELAKIEQIAGDIFAEYGENLAMVLGPWLKQFGCEILVIGGNISGAYHLFESEFKQVLLKQGVETEIAISALKEDAAILGSARMLEDEYWDRVSPQLSKM